jgi:hypothetical protein
MGIPFSQESKSKCRQNKRHLDHGKNDMTNQYEKVDWSDNPKTHKFSITLKVMISEVGDQKKPTQTARRDHNITMEIALTKPYAVKA